MINSRRFAAVIASALVAFGALTISGCASTLSAVSQLIDETVGAAIGETVDAETGEARGGLGGLAALENVMLFNVAYMQVLFLGGHDPGFDDFREGDGVTFEITGGEEGDESSFTAERGLLKRNSDGTSWWFLGYQSGEDVLEYEVLMDNEYVPLEIVWRDGDSRETMRHTFDYGEEEEQPPTEEESVVYSDEFYDEYSRGNERITVRSGSYRAEHVAYEIEDTETGARLEYHWWLVDEVPGDLVKYEYRQFDEGGETMISGELVAVDDGYMTRFDAY
ncbi:MAG: hypothetical protein V3S41_03100 [Spirochaetia bacterium]